MLIFILTKELNIYIGKMQDLNATLHCFGINKGIEAKKVFSYLCVICKWQALTTRKKDEIPQN